MRHAAFAAAFLTGCLPYSPVENPAPPIDVPDAYGSGGENAAREDAGRWWEAFEDPALSSMQEQVLADNLQLRGAWARLDQAHALAAQAGAPQWPQVNLELSAGRSRRAISLPGPMGTTTNVIEQNNYSASIPVAYELDLFNKYGAGAAAAGLDARAARHDIEALAFTLTAQVAETWYGLVESRARTKLLEQQLEINETFLELIQLRFGQGQASAVDVYQQQQQIQGTRARLALVEAQQHVLHNQLGALLGQAPGRGPAAERDELPELSALPAVGVPSDLLRYRPDVEAARLRIVSADYRVGAAIADRFPSIRLNGSIGFGATSLASLLDELIWSIAGSISQSLIDGGRRGAEIDRNEAVVRERLEQFGQTLLTAMVEVDNALVQERQQVLHIEQLEAQVETANNNLRESRARYREGLTDFLPVLQALTSLQATELNLLSARRQLVSYRIQLHRALGGTWTATLVAPPPREPVERSGEQG